MICPRRSEGPVPHGLPAEDAWEPDGTCSFCGSMTPDAFMQAVTEGREIEPTDKSYKAYVPSVPGVGKFYYQHLSEAQQQTFVDLLNAKKIVIGYPGHFYVRPFFVFPVVA